MANSLLLGKSMPLGRKGGKRPVYTMSRETNPGPQQWGWMAVKLWSPTARLEEGKGSLPTKVALVRGGGGGLSHLLPFALGSLGLFARFER
jgi:hypothetical protein